MQGVLWKRGRQSTVIAHKSPVDVY